MTLGDVERNKKDDDARPVEEMRAVTSLCALLKARSVRVQGIQLLLGFMLVARSTNRQVSINMVDIHFVCTCTNVLSMQLQAITVLNHAGICKSYTNIWDHLRRLITQSWYQDIVKSGHCSRTTSVKFRPILFWPEVGVAVKMSDCKAECDVCGERWL